MDNKSYTNSYQEEECIGRGSFGAAFIVNQKKENKKYIAKKLSFNGLQPKEQEACMMEVNLLKNLDHPNIVKFKESFFNTNQLVIVMEYCEGGDLGEQIKRKVNKPGEFFTETEITNWFL